MSDWHAISNLPAPLIVDRSDGEFRLALPEVPASTFVPVFIPALTRQSAGQVIERAHHESRPRLFVSFRRSSPEARAALRAAEISFAGDDGHLYVRAPGILVERGDVVAAYPIAAVEFDRAGTVAVRNPYAIRGSRIARWMLLYPEQAFSPSSLAGAVDLNAAAVSRLVTALEEGALVREEASEPRRGRHRSVRLARPMSLLEDWLPVWRRRRIQRWRWDIGARDVDGALGLLKEAESIDGWAVGGLVGAATIRRVVEPVAVSVWTSPAAVERLASTLDPIDTAGGRGSLEVSVAPDPWTLQLARLVDGLRVADPVQLWLDCASEGERALEAAEAVAQSMNWS